MKRVSFDVVVQAWLRAEWFSPNNGAIRNSNQALESLVNGENFDNQLDNQSRLKILREVFGRSLMIDPLPSDTEWYSASYDKEDIERTYHVSDEWNFLSNDTHHPLKVMKNLHLDDDRAKKINDIISSLSQKTLDRRLILVGTDTNSRLTIIEGNHRAVAIFKDAGERNIQNPIIEEVFVGISPHMKDYIFHKCNLLRQATEINKN